MSKVKRFSLEERYGYQNRKVIYDKNADNDIELNNIYPIIDLLNQLYEQISDLEAKLAEKDKEISNLNGLIRERDKQIKNLKTNKKRVIEHKNNVKISFCIEQLEKVKGLIANHTQELWTCENDDIDVVLYEEIDKQIKEIQKGEE